VLLENVPPDSVDICTLIFVLSAIHPEKFDTALKNIHSVMKCGGSILFRDYGLYDMAQLRFKPGHKIAEKLYMRQDGTR
jgi:methyltransferase-like protein 6